MANMLASFAEFERSMISQRTKDGLAAKKAAGVRVGRPRGVPERVRARIERERASGRSLRAIADGLNADAIPTGQGGSQWHASTVSKLLAVQ
jgi:DNA invertase Pin-like site-specific DNA recombinase